MKRLRKIGYPGLVLVLVSFFILGGCATAKQNPWQKKRSKASHVNTSQLGRNKYYFSVGYQKRLVKSYKK